MNLADFVEDLARSVAFLSRLPVPDRFFNDYDGRLSRAVRAFPLAGLVICLPQAALLAVLMWIGAEPLMAALLVLGMQAALTGCLHEDGLADTADGLGGGRNREDALAIMKDSRIGTYGATILIITIGIRVTALATMAATLSPVAAALALLGVASLSRAAMVWHWDRIGPARKDGVAASVGQPEAASARLAEYGGVAIAGLLLLLVAGFLPAFGSILLAIGLVWWHTRHVDAKLGGHTGDTLGASQQISEIAALAGLALLI